ncbi:VWA domain-containing protein [Bradyrhizobium sp. TZ2]
MHNRWHQCFGAVGRSNGNNPLGRSQRWYAFHRQFEIDYNEWREVNTPALGTIQAYEWCPNMNMPHGHFGASSPASGGCGGGPDRPNNTPCPLCQAFPQCLFFGGAGPTACPAAPSATCGTPGGFTRPYTTLEQFPNIEEVSAILDAYFHGAMHYAVGVADRQGPTCDPGSAVTTTCYKLDSLSSNCSPRDPMFWRLHKALDDVVRAWQDSKAVDVVLVVDTSGSMSEPDSTGVSKHQAAVNAINLFADLLEESRPDGQTNRVGIVTYASGPLIRLSLTNVTPGFRAPGGAFDNALNAILSAPPTGCTGIGLGIEKALELLCPPSGHCGGFTATGDNDRKSIVLLTDGIENVPPCLNPAGPSGGTCGGQCFGSQLDYGKLEYTQVVSVGFGQSGSLNGQLLTTLSERQGGVYLQNPNGPGDDLKHFYVKAMGTVSGETVAIDPDGVLAATDPATRAVEYQSCGDSSLTFTGTWGKPVQPNDVRLLVTSPKGDLVVGSPPAVEASTESLWAFSRIRMPYKGATSGTWRAELIRPHQTFVNGFSPKGFVDLDAGAALVRRQIHRLCPDGCKRVLYFEDTGAGNSAYELALKLDGAAGLLGDVEQARNASAFAAALERGGWDLVVHAQTGDDVRHEYDNLLASSLCGGQRAIVSDSRPRAAATILRCSGALSAGKAAWSAIDADGALITNPLKFRDDSQLVWALKAIGPAKVAAVGAGGQGDSIVVRIRDGQEQRWFIDVLARGLSKITPVNFRSRWTTGDRVLVGARILPSYNRAGGYDFVDARVEVEYPTVGLGTLLAQQATEERRVEGESLPPAIAALTRLQVPTQKATFKLNDDGVDGDEVAGNGYYTGTLDGIPFVDGHYKLRFIFDFTADGCTTRRETNQSLFVEVGADPDHSKINIRPRGPGSGGSQRLDLNIAPADRRGNLVGPGQTARAVCLPSEDCRIASDGVLDLGRGNYALTFDVAPGVGSVRLNAFGTHFDVKIPCETCGGLRALELSEKAVREHASVTGMVQLSSPAPRTGAGGAVVFLSSSDARVAPVPESVVVPAGETIAKFNVTVEHLTESKVKGVRIRASYGGQALEARLTIAPGAHAQVPTPATLPPGDHPHYTRPRP